MVKISKQKWIGIFLHFFRNPENNIFPGVDTKDMILKEYIKEHIQEADNLYDLISNCFALLCDNITNPADFISKYLSTGREMSNPNLPELHLFSEKIMEETERYKPSQYTEFIQKVNELINQLKLVEYQVEKENQLTVIYFILSGIDAGARFWEYSKFFSMLGPLDRQHKTHYRVYANLHRTIHSEFIDNVGRDRIHSSNFFEEFETFRFIDDRIWKPEMNGPRIMYMPLSKLNRQQEKKEIKIAVIPGSRTADFQFSECEGSAIKVEYPAKTQQRIIDSIILSLDSAVEVGADIIVLPEYVTSPEIYDTVCTHLKKLYITTDISRQPFLIFSGSTWMNDDNNVMRILDACGDEIGVYYKYSPFTKKKKGEKGFVQCEKLSSPGRFCDLVAVENIGMFLPAICRDVIDADYTENISRMLLPAFVIISAWSRSVASFVQRQKELANKYFVSSVLANACSAVSENADVIGNAAIVHKEGTVAGSLIKDICRNSCNELCKESACVFIVEYDFSYNQAENKNTDLRIYKL